MAIRALLIHRAELPKTAARIECGWGRFLTDPVQLITCDDNEAIVVYQGVLPVSEHLRVPLPLPAGNINGFVHITATLAIAPEVDPEHPGAYTRSGLEVAFRPHSGKFGKSMKGKPPQQPKTKPFFSSRLLYGKSEAILREDGHKWEPCLRGTARVQPRTLKEPCFDIYYNHREAGAKAKSPQPIPYALIVGIHAPKSKDLYNNVVRTYARLLVQLKPQTRIVIRT